jgi:tetratricopeptide (TPR) repeat protein
LLLIAVGVYQQKTEEHLTNHTTEKFDYLPSGTFLKGLALGFDEALADYFWVRTVLYFGTHVKTDRDYTWLTHMLRLTSELDPRYESPYEFAGLILPSELNDVDGAIAFLEKGIQDIPKHNPRYWLQPFYLGFCYMVYKREPIRAAQYFEMATAYPQSPVFLKLLVTRLYASENRPEVAIQFIRNILEAPDSDLKLNEHTRTAMEKRLKELIVAQHTLVLEKAITEYVARFQRNPNALDDLVTAQIIPGIPKEPFGGAYHLSENGDTVYSTEAEGRFKVYIYKD